jgi:uncharacterized Zn finger protein (UPF0148 family)
MTSCGNRANQCSRCGGAVLRGAKGGFFCCVCGQEKRWIDENKARSKDVYAPRMCSNRRNKREKGQLFQKRTGQRIVPVNEKELLNAQEIERLNKLYEKRSKMLADYSEQSTGIKWVQGKMQAVDPSKYRGSFQDKD